MIKVFYDKITKLNFLNEYQKKTVDIIFKILFNIKGEDLSTHSNFFIKNGIVNINLVHKLDSLNIIDIIVGKKDIIVKPVFMYDNINFQFKNDIKYFDNVHFYINEILTGQFSKNIYYKDNIPKVAILSFDSTILKERVHTKKIIELVKFYLYKKKYTNKTFKYVSFINNTRQRPIVKDLRKG